MGMFLNGAKIIGMKTITEHPMMEVLGYLMMKALVELVAAAPGTTLRGIAALLTASTASPSSATTLSVFGSFVLRPGLFSSPLPFYPLATIFKFTTELCSINITKVLQICSAKVSNV